MSAPDRSIRRPLDDARPPLPGDDTPLESANDRFKRSFPARLWGSMLVATLLHLAVFALWPTMTAPVLGDVGADDLEVVVFPPLELPEPPAPIAKPVPPTDPSVELPDEATIAPTVWPDRTELPPPPPAVEEGRDRRRERWVPVEVQPELRNLEEVRRALLREYPASYREAGIGATVVVELHLDRDGSILETGIAVSSGHDAFDRAALRVARLCRFSPAMNRDRPVAVWVTVPMVFESR